MQVRDRLTALHNACPALRRPAPPKAAQNKVTKALEKLSKTAPAQVSSCTSLAVWPGLRCSSLVLSHAGPHAYLGGQV